MDGGEEISGGLVVTGGDGPILLELAEEILHQVTCLIQFPVEGALDLSIALGWDHELFSRKGAITRWSASKALSASRVSACM